MPSENNKEIDLVFSEASFGTVTVKGFPCLDTLRINSFEIKNQTFINAFVIDNPGQSSTNGLPFDVGYFELF